MAYTINGFDGRLYSSNENVQSLYIKELNIYIILKETQNIKWKFLSINISVGSKCKNNSSIEYTIPHCLAMF